MTRRVMGWAVLALAMSGCVSGGDGEGGGSDGGASAGGGDPFGNLGGLGGNNNNNGGGGGSGTPITTSVSRSTPITEVTEANGTAFCQDVLRAVQSRIDERQLCTFLAIQQAADTGPDEIPTDAAACQMQVQECEGFIGQFLTPAICTQGESEPMPELPEHCAQLTVGDLADCVGDGLDATAALGRGWTCNDVARADELALDDADAPAPSAACARIDEICPELNDDEASGGPGDDFPPDDNMGTP